tara:strand:- start:1083 stop:1349 length:267 start_codon:yes stop_codon:yes gene_type:complete
MDDTILLVCPHCESMMELIKSQINCAIYRHGVYKSTGQQIDPHAKKEICDKLVETDSIYGCGKPFKLFQNKNPISKTIEYYVEKCDYV